MSTLKCRACGTNDESLSYRAIGNLLVCSDCHADAHFVRGSDFGYMKMAQLITSKLTATEAISFMKLLRKSSWKFEEHFEGCVKKSHAIEYEEYQEQLEAENAAPEPTVNNETI
jgi:hypothetical protein